MAWREKFLGLLPRKDGWVGCTAAALLAVFVLFCLRAADDTSTTYDEPGHILAGYSYWSDAGPEIATANLRAIQLWLALPLLPLDLHHPQPTGARSSLVVGPGAGALGRTFLHDARHDPSMILRRSRAAITVLGVLLGLALFLWSRKIFGNAGGLLTLGLFCFDPTVIAHSALATTDIAATLLFTAALAAWWRLLHRVSLGSVLLCGVSTGLLASAKISAVLLGPTVLILLGLRLALGRELEIFWRGHHVRTTRRAMLAPLAVGAGSGLALAYGLIWAIYGFRYASGGLLPEWVWFDLTRPEATPVQRAIHFVRTHRLLPEAYTYDLHWFISSSVWRRSFLLGDFSVEGWTAYFPVAWLTKTPLPTLLALMLAAGAMVMAAVRPNWPEKWAVYSLLPLAVFGGIYALLAIGGSMNLGLRHFLPVYPLLLVFAGAAAAWGGENLPRWRRWGVAALLGWGGFTAWRASPFFLSYFNPVAGGTWQGHRVLLESNYDWGQDLPRVSRWLRQRGPGPTPVYFAYYGMGEVTRYGITARLLPQEPEFRPLTLYALKPGTYVISATLLQGLGGHAVWGPWRATLEQRYQQLRADCAPYYASLRAGGRGPATVTQRDEDNLRLYDELRFARLCAHLRQRTENDRITPAIFVFEVTAPELTAALEGPPPPLAGEPAIRGAAKLSDEVTNFVR